MSTLQNFGITGATGTDGGILQPKLNYQFRVSLTGFGNNPNPVIFTRQVMNVSRPKLTHESITLDSYNSRAYIAGKHTWDPISVVLRDDAANNLSKLVNSQVQKQINHRTQLAPTATNNLNGENYKFKLFIQTLNGTNSAPTETFEIEGCFLENVDYGAQDYSSSEPVQLTLSIRYDNCISTNDPDAISGAAG